MRLRLVEIARFRGIRELTWTVNGHFLCLIGPGDSTKSTVLDAIDFVLSPRWNLAFDDSDFYRGDTSAPINLRVTVGELPDEFRRDDKFGHHVRGWSPDGRLHDEPEDEDELVVTIQLAVEEPLEPTWRVVNDRDPDGRPISAADREKLGCARVGPHVDRHLTWSRGSLLSRMTGKVEETSAVLANAGRAARGALAELPRGDISELYDAADAAQKLGVHVDVTAEESYRPHLDLSALSINTGALALHVGDVPLRRLGLGSRRLLATALHRQTASAHGITLIDEIEHGLEPHRIRRLLRYLHGKTASESADDGDEKPAPRHVLMTTHAPVVIQELEPEHLHVVRARGGTTSIKQVPSELKNVIRGAAEALLTRRVIVCEGKTEVGFCRALDRWWSESGDGFGMQGVGLVYGAGRTNAPGKAIALASLGYHVAYLGDADAPLKPSAKTLLSHGIEVWLWKDELMIEGRIARDLPWGALATLLTDVSRGSSQRSVRDAVAARLNVKPDELALDPAKWSETAADNGALRTAIGWTSAKKEWFKSVEGGEVLGQAAITSLSSISGTDLADKITAIMMWTAG